jgi:uncharacterized protein (TIGR02270 family)
VPIVSEIVEQHAEDAAFLWHRRDLAVESAHYRLADLADLDERLEAQIDAIRVAGDAGVAVCEERLSAGDAGEIFVRMVLAAERGDLQAIARLLDRGGGSADASREIASALGWVDAPRFDDLLPGFLDPACPPPLQWVGISACAARRLDPGDALARALSAGEGRLIARALRAVGQLGRRELLPNVRRHLDAEDDTCRFAAAWSAVLLGDVAVVPTLWTFATFAAGRERIAASARALALRAMSADAGRARVDELATGGDGGGLRSAVIGAGTVGDPTLVPWLLERMRTPELARVAGESFSLITGVDLVAERLAIQPPQGFSSGPTEDANDDDTALDPDEHLPWPDVDGLQTFWARRGGGFAPRVRHLLGQPIVEGSPTRALRRGTQRQRAAAALEITLRAPGHPLFEVRAPASRQLQALGGG